MTYLYMKLVVKETTIFILLCVKFYFLFSLVSVHLINMQLHHIKCKICSGFAYSVVGLKGLN